MSKFGNSQYVRKELNKILRNFRGGNYRAISKQIKKEVENIEFESNDKPRRLKKINFEKDEKLMEKIQRLREKELPPESERFILNVTVFRASEEGKREVKSNFLYEGNRYHVTQVMSFDPIDLPKNRGYKPGENYFITNEDSKYLHDIYIYMRKF